MSDNVEVPFGDDAGETATLLLAAAEDLDLPADSVLTTSDSTFSVPEDVAKKAGVDYESDDESDDEDKPKKPAKKAAAKKTAKKA